MEQLSCYAIAEGVQEKRQKPEVQTCNLSE